ncbi:hypothetical protein B0H13DRAFT_1916739 [Mycena leptocephala]|nr:hypothetical protein B0H13DRAFT_1916739 [Mycena leptocephala]
MSVSAGFIALSCWTSRSRCARHVRSLLILWPHNEGGPPELTYLNTIDLPTSPELFSVLSDIHFPRLRQCTIPFSADTFRFLELHLDLVHLSIDPVPHDSAPFPPIFRPLSLAHLEIFSGPDVVALSVIPGSRAAHVIVFWDPRLETHSDDLFAAIANSGTQLCEVHNVMAAWDPTLLAAITKNIPTLRSLAIRNVSSVPAPIQFEEFISCMDDTIKSIPSLTSLCIVRGTRLRPTLSPGDLDWEFETVRRWGNISPAFIAASFRATRCGSTSLPPAYGAMLEVIGGKDMVATLREVFEEEGELPRFELAQLPTGISMTIVPSSG